MAIKIQCNCGNIILAPENSHNKTGNCPYCSIPITIQNPKPPKKRPIYKFIKNTLTLTIYLLFILLILFEITIHFIPKSKKSFKELSFLQNLYNDTYVQLLQQEQEKKKKK